MIVYLARDISPFVMYCVNGKPRSPLFIESTDSMIHLFSVFNSQDEVEAYFEARHLFKTAMANSPLKVNNI